MTALTAIRAGFGGVCLAAPQAVPGLAPPLDGRMRLVVRILGARHLVQAWLIGRSPTVVRHGVGGGIDVAHAATMVTLARVDRRRRRPALTNAAIALTFAGADFRSARRIAEAGGLR